MRPSAVWQTPQRTTAPPSFTTTPCSSTTAAGSGTTEPNAMTNIQPTLCPYHQPVGMPSSILPAVVLLPEESLNETSVPTSGGTSAGSARLMRDASVDMQSPLMEVSSSSGSSFFGGQLQRVQSRSPSASSLNAYSSRHSSPNPSPPPTSSGGPQPKALSPRSLSHSGGAASVARMMSALLKQQNSIAEEEDSLLLGDEDGADAAEADGRTATTSAFNNLTHLEQRLNLPPNGTPPHIGGTSPATGADADQQQPKNWLAPPLDFVLLAGNISPPPSRMHPITDQELRYELQHNHDGGVQLADHPIATTVVATACSANAQFGTYSVATVQTLQHNHSNNHYQHHRHHYQHHQHRATAVEEKFHRQQSQPTWTRAIGGANSKHRKGSLSPNNSLRYSTLMAAARRNHFHQQRTTSEATPAQRDLLMADVMGHGIRDKYCCASTSAPSPQLAQDGHESGGGTMPSQTFARFALGADGDSSNSSLNNHACSSANATPCSQCSSENSLLHFQHNRVGSVKQRTHRQRPQAGQRSCATNDEGGAKADNNSSGSLPKLVALVQPAFPPSSVMLMSSNSNEQLGNASGSQQQLPSAASSGWTKRRKSRANAMAQQPQLQQQNVVGKQCQDKASPTHHLLCPPDKQRRTANGGSTEECSGTIGPTDDAAAVVVGRDPSRWNLASTKQRSSSESAFNMPTAASDLAQPHCSCCTICKSASPDGTHRCMHLPYLHVESVPLGVSSVRAVSLGMASAGTPPSCNGDTSLICGSGLGKLHCPMARTRNGTMRRPDSLSALGRHGHKQCATIAMMPNNAQREQAILQRILGPAGLGWLKQQRRLESQKSENCGERIGKRVNGILSIRQINK